MKINIETQGEYFVSKWYFDANDKIITIIIIIIIIPF